MNRYEQMKMQRSFATLRDHPRERARKVANHYAAHAVMAMEMMKVIKRYKTVEKFDTSTWEGVIIGMIIERGLRRAHEKFSEVDSYNINQALQTFRNESFGGIVPDITYTNTNHSASWIARIVKVNEDQTYTPMTSFWAPGKEKVKILK